MLLRHFQLLFHHGFDISSVAFSLVVEGDTLLELPRLKIAAISSSFGSRGSFSHEPIGHDAPRYISIPQSKSRPLALAEPILFLDARSQRVA